MKPIVKFQLFWWGLCTAIVVTYASFNGWTAPNITGAILYAGLFVFEYLWWRRSVKTKTWNQRVADGDI